MRLWFYGSTGLSHKEVDEWNANDNEMPNEF